jgi:hypothetical protein
LTINSSVSLVNFSPIFILEVICQGFKFTA